MAKHRKEKPRITFDRPAFDKNASALDIVLYEIEHGWIGVTIMLLVGVLLFITGAIFGVIKGN
jgi:hypothetical protein